MLTIKQGATHRHVWVYCEPDGETPISLEGFEARLQVRSEESAEPSIDLDSVANATGSARLTLEPLDDNDEPLVGEIHLYLGATVTAALPAGELGVGDLELYDPADEDEVEPLVQEAFFVVVDMARPNE